MSEQKTSLWDKWKVQVSFTAGALLISSIWGTCSYVPRLPSPEELSKPEVSSPTETDTSAAHSGTVSPEAVTVTPDGATTTASDGTTTPLETKVVIEATPTTEVKAATEVKPVAEPVPVTHTK